MKISTDRRFGPRLAGAFFIALFLMLSCSEKPTISSEDKEAFISTYVDLTLAKAKYQDLQKDYETARTVIYDRNGTDEKFLNEFLEKIESKIEIQEEIFKAISEELEKYEKMPTDSLNRYLKDMLNQP